MTSACAWPRACAPETGAGVLLFVKAALYEEVCTKVME